MGITPVSQFSHKPCAYKFFLKLTPTLLDDLGNLSMSISPLNVFCAAAQRVKIGELLAT